MEISAIILGGGHSRRMGCDKTLLTVDGQSLMTATVAALRPISNDLIIASNSTSKYGFKNTREVKDSFPDCGPLGGIHAALTAARNDISFVVAGDLPHFHNGIVSFLLSLWSDDLQMVMPIINGRSEPLCALYHRSVTETIQAMLADGNLASHHLANRVCCCCVPEDTLAKAGFPREFFFNMNTPADYQIVTSGGWQVYHE